MTTTLADVIKAEKRIHQHFYPTPIEKADGLGENTFFKLENLNFTRSFKIRGALNAILNLSEAERARGIITASAGNHAQGVAYAAQLTHTPATVIMPKHTPQRKVQGTERYGANVILHGEGYTAAEIFALEQQHITGRTYISPYNHRDVIAGQGTIAMELFEQLPRIDRVIVPVSGGGLIAGIALVCKLMNLDCEVVGVQSTATPAMYNYLYNTQFRAAETIAEGLEGEIEPGSMTLEMCRQYVDQVLLVEENLLGENIRWMLETHNWVIEGAAAVGIAALRSGQIPSDEKTTVVIIGGGNLDYTTLQSLLH